MREALRGAGLSVLFFALLWVGATVIGGVGSASQITAPLGGVAFASDDKGRRPCAKNSDCSAGRICSQDGRCEKRPNRIRPRPEPPPINSHCTPPSVWDPTVGFCVWPPPPDPCYSLVRLVEDAANKVVEECPDLGTETGIVTTRVDLTRSCVLALDALREATEALALCRG